MNIYFTVVFMIIVAQTSFSKIQNDGLKNQLKGTGQYGFSGCGFGSMIFEPKENQLIAITSNHITSSQAFGISSGTSNCVDNLPMIEHAQRLPDFIEMNKEKLSAEAAKGKGETINTLSTILDCKPQEVATTLKENYKRIFVDTKMESASIEASLHNLIDDNQQCF
jgi:hypothetical protein